MLHVNKRNTAGNSKRLNTPVLDLHTVYMQAGIYNGASGA